MDASGSPVASAVPDRLVKFAAPASSFSPAARIASLGSTPKTRAQCGRSSWVKIPVPEPMSDDGRRPEPGPLVQRIDHAAG